MLTAALMLLAATATAAPAPAQAEQTILLRSSVGAPPTDANYYIGFMLRLLGDEAPLHGPALRRRVEARLSRPAGTRGSTTDLRALVKDGRRLMIEGEFAQAAARLEQARVKILARTAEVASDQGLRRALHATLLLSAHASLRTGRAQRATELVSEVIRSFPDRELSLVKYSPDLVKFYKKVRRELDRQQRGTLTVTTRRPGCMVFVNERFVGLSPTKVVDLYPGRYRVYLQRQERRGRVHAAAVEGQDHQLALDFNLDRVLRTTPQVGLRFHDEAALARGEIDAGAAVARAVGASQALLVGLRRHNERLALSGTLVSASTGQIVRSGLVALEPAAPSPEVLRVLGQFLVAGKPGIGIVIRPLPKEGGVPGAGGTDAGGAGSSWIGIAKWVGLGVGVAGLAAGITLIALDGEGTCDTAAGDRCKDTYETLAPGVALTATGGVAAAAAAVLFILDARRGGRSSEAVGLSPVGPRRSAGLTAVVRF